MSLNGCQVEIFHTTGATGKERRVVVSAINRHCVIIYQNQNLLMSEKVWLSSPHMGGNELNYIHKAFDTNWIVPLGPNVNPPGL
jgi:hypothetical protein